MSPASGHENPFAGMSQVFRVAFCLQCAWAKSGATSGWEHLISAAQQHADMKDHQCRVVETAYTRDQTVEPIPYDPS